MANERNPDDGRSTPALERAILVDRAALAACAAVVLLVAGIVVATSRSHLVTIVAVAVTFLAWAGAMAWAASRPRTLPAESAVATAPSSTGVPPLSGRIHHEASNIPSAGSTDAVGAVTVQGITETGRNESQRPERPTLSRAEAAKRLDAKAWITDSREDHDVQCPSCGEFKQLAPSGSKSQALCRRCGQKFDTQKEGRPHVVVPGLSRDSA